MRCNAFCEHLGEQCGRVGDFFTGPIRVCDYHMAKKTFVFALIVGHLPCAEGAQVTVDTDALLSAFVWCFTVLCGASLIGLGLTLFTLRRVCENYFAHTHRTSLYQLGASVVGAYFGSRNFNFVSQAGFASKTRDIMMFLFMLFGSASCLFGLLGYASLEKQCDRFVTQMKKYPLVARFINLWEEYWVRGEFVIPDINPSYSPKVTELISNQWVEERLSKITNYFTDALSPDILPNLDELVSEGGEYVNPLTTKITTAHLSLDNFRSRYRRGSLVQFPYLGAFDYDIFDEYTSMSWNKMVLSVIAAFTAIREPNDSRSVLQLSYLYLTHRVLCFTSNFGPCPCRTSGVRFLLPYDSTSSNEFLGDLHEFYANLCLVPLLFPLSANHKTTRDYAARVLPYEILINLRKYASLADTGKERSRNPDPDEHCSTAGLGSPGAPSAISSSELARCSCKPPGPHSATNHCDWLFPESTIHMFRCPDLIWNASELNDRLIACKRLYSYGRHLHDVFINGSPLKPRVIDTYSGKMPLLRSYEEIFKSFQDRYFVIHGERPLDTGVFAAAYGDKGSMLVPSEAAVELSPIALSPYEHKVSTSVLAGFVRASENAKEKDPLYYNRGPNSILLAIPVVTPPPTVPVSTEPVDLLKTRTVVKPWFISPIWGAIGCLAAAAIAAMTAQYFAAKKPRNPHADKLGFDPWEVARKKYLEEHKHEGWCDDDWTTEGAKKKRKKGRKRGGASAYDYDKDGNIIEYHEFISPADEHFAEYKRVFRNGKQMWERNTGRKSHSKYVMHPEAVRDKVSRHRKDPRKIVKLLARPLAFSGKTPPLKHRNKIVTAPPGELEAVQFKERLLEGEVRQSLLNAHSADVSAVQPRLYQILVDGLPVMNGVHLGNKLFTCRHSVWDAIESGSKVEAKRDGVVHVLACDKKTNGVLLRESLDLVYFPFESYCESPRLPLRPPEHELVALVAFDSNGHLRVSVGAGSPSGLCSYASQFGDCGGAVISLSDGFVVGFHQAGGSFCNFFQPISDEIVDVYRENLPKQGFRLPPTSD
jgi:hypothetical protein